MNRELLSIEDAAKKVGRSPRYLRDLIRTERLKAERYGSFWLVHLADLERAAQREFRGRGESRKKTRNRG